MLIPCLLITKISLSPLDKSALGFYSVTILGGFVAALIFEIISARLKGFAAPQATSILQGSARHNAFIGLALAENHVGPAGFDIAILAAGVALAR